MTRTARSAQKKSIFPPIFAWNNWFSQETQAIWKKLKQLLGKTQENIQKLKQNEHQVLSCSQKKCKIKTPGAGIFYCQKWFGGLLGTPLHVRQKRRCANDPCLSQFYLFWISKCIYATCLSMKWRKKEATKAKCPL